MESSKAEFTPMSTIISEIRFVDETMTSSGGLVMLHFLLERLGIKSRLHACFGALGRAGSFGLATLTPQLVVQILVGFRRLRDRDYYAAAPRVCGVLGLLKLRDVATSSRTLSAATKTRVEKLRPLLRELVLGRLKQIKLGTVSVDGNGQSTRRHAERLTVGFNKVRKDAYSYCSLFCTVSQTGQFFDILHRGCNVHDSRGAGVRPARPPPDGIAHRRRCRVSRHNIERVVHALRAAGYRSRSRPHATQRWGRLSRPHPEDSQ